MINTPDKLPEGIVLGFDYGLTQIGLAVAQTLTKSVRPVAILKASEGVPDWQRVAAYFAEFRPACVVVGLPLNMDGSDSEMALRARKFANRLHGRFGVPVYLQDERLSSQETRQRLRDEAALQQRTDQRRKKAKRADTIDALAATVILESWFVSQEPADQD